jgi:dienelactone hydrolase
MVHVWFPADRTETTHHTARIARGAERFPVVIYSPGWPGTKIDNNGLIRELASHGFIVFGMTYPARLAAVSDEVRAQQIRELEHWIIYSSEEVYRHAVQYATERVRFRAQEVLSLLDGLADLDAAPDTLVANRLDLCRVGVIGYSLGGAVAAEAVSMDSRFCAAVNIDGRHWGTALQSGVKQPYLFIGEELTPPSPADLASPNPDRRYNAHADRFDFAQLAKNLRRNGGMQVTIMGAAHEDFTDRGPPLTLRRLRRIGRIRPRKVRAALNTYVLAFLKGNLVGKDEALLAGGPWPLPGTRVQVWQPEHVG